MIGFVEGYSDTNIINYCPACGAEIIECFADGFGKCPECGMKFAVIEKDDESEANYEK